MNLEKIALEPTQVEDMDRDGDWLRLSDAQSRFIAETPSGFVPVFRERDIVRVPAKAMAEAVTDAFRAAVAQAVARLQHGATMDDVVSGAVTIEPDALLPWSRYVRVSATDSRTGRTASGVGRIATTTAH